MRNRAWLIVIGVLAAASGCIRMQPAPPGLNDGEPCASSGQCKEGSECTSSICRVVGGCIDDYGCPAGNICDFGLCRLKECEPFDPAHVCAPFACVNALCARECTKDDACGAGYVCRGGTCISGACDASNAPVVCAGSACDVASGMCLDSFHCEEDGCAAGFICDLYECKKPCGSDPDCAPFQCDQDSFCRTDCYSDKECQAGYLCKDLVCVPG